jgi:hypothetical protein
MFSSKFRWKCFEDPHLVLRKKAPIDGYFCITVLIWTKMFLLEVIDFKDLYLKGRNKAKSRG